MPMDNEERAYHALDALTGYLRSKGEPCDDACDEYEISDLVCDLFHHGDRLGFDHRTILERALMHYEAEKAEEQAEADASADTAAEVLDALEKAIAAMNNTPNFNTGIYDPVTGRNLTSYRLLPELQAVVRKVRAA